MCACILCVQDHHAPSTATDANLTSNGYATLRPYSYSPACRFLSVYSPATNPAGDDVIIHLARQAVRCYASLQIPHIKTPFAASAAGRWNLCAIWEQSPVRIPNQATGRYRVFRGLSQCLQAIVRTLTNSSPPTHYTIQGIRC